MMASSPSPISPAQSSSSPISPAHSQSLSTSVSSPSLVSPAHSVSENLSNRNTLPKNVSFVKTPGSYNLNNSFESESEDDIPAIEPKGTFLLLCMNLYLNYRSAQNIYDKEEHEAKEGRSQNGDDGTVHESCDSL